MARILIVEDERIIAENTSMFLKNMGHDVISMVGDGNSAIESTERNSPQIILMDIHLQGKLNGIETAKIIEKRFGTPIIYITAHNSYKEEALKTTHSACLLKPFDLSELKNAIDSAFEDAK